MTVIGVDPGLTSIGYGVLESQGKSILVKAFGSFTTSNKEPLSSRLKSIHNSVRNIIREYEPDALACETVFYCKNARSTILLGHARGAVLLAAEDSGIRVLEFSPREIKSAVGGRGSSSKNQVRFMVKAQLNIADLPESSDISDALAVALCCLHREEDESRRSEKESTARTRTSR